MTDSTVLPTVNFEESVYVVDEGNTVTVNVVRGDDGGVVPVNVGEWQSKTSVMCRNCINCVGLTKLSIVFYWMISEIS